MRSLFLLLSLLLIAFLLSCGSARRGIPLTGPENIQDEELLLGRRVFDRSCSQCHPGGEGGLGFAINNKPLPGFLMKFQIRHGVGAMPPFRKEFLTDVELDAVVSYLKFLRKRERVR